MPSFSMCLFSILYLIYESKADWWVASTIMAVQPQVRQLNRQQKKNAS